jgi:hypothetical protein
VTAQRVDAGSFGRIEEPHAYKIGMGFFLEDIRAGKII